MGEPHLLYIGYQIGGDIPIAEELPLAGAPPGAQVTFINIHRAGIGDIFGPILQPGLVAPLVGVLPQIIDLGRHIGPGSGVEAVRIGFAHEGAVLFMYGILIGVIAAQPWDKRLPDAALQLSHGGGFQVPAVEVADDGDLRGVGGPHPEQIALSAGLVLRWVGAETPPRMGGTSL